MSSIDAALRALIRAEVTSALANHTCDCKATALPEHSGWLVATEASQLLRVSVKTLANWRAAGIGPPFSKGGRVVRYRRADIDSWLRSSRS